MLKGVNKRVIEVNRPDSLYFERAVFYLRPGADELPTRAALLESERYLAGQLPPERPKSRGLWWFLLGMAVSASISVLLLLLLR